MQTVGAYVIAKNESTMVEDCLRSLKGFDDIVFVDTGSTDDTIEKAKKFPVRIFEDFKWCNHFAKARNHALSKCTTDWVFRLDCDEMLIDGGIRIIRSLIEQGIYNAINILISYPPHSHYEPRLFKRIPEHTYIGAAHEYLNTHNAMDSAIAIFARSSPTHKKNPSLALTILEKELSRDPSLVREKFYYARELYLHKRYDEAIFWFDKYLLVSNWIFEKAEGYYFKSLCLWQLHRGKEARQELVKAILINPNMKKALVQMAAMNNPKEALAWRKFSELANNDDVVFK